MYRYTEIYNTTNLTYLKSLDYDTINNLIGNGYDEEELKNIYKTIERLRTPNIITYNYAKGSSCGRLYADRPCLQNLPKTIRYLLVEDLDYHDYDLVNAHYQITLQFCKEQNMDCLHIEKYCKDRQAVLDKEYQTKKSMLMFLYQDKPKCGDSIYLKGLCRELTQIKKKMTQLKTHLISTTSKTNKLSSLFSKVVGIRENKIIMKVVEHFKEDNPSLIFDGYMTRNERDTKQMKILTGMDWSEKEIEKVDKEQNESTYMIKKKLFEKNAFWTREPLQRYLRLSPNHPYTQQTKNDFLDKLAEWGLEMTKGWEKDPTKRAYETCVFNPDPNFNNDNIYNTFIPFKMTLPDQPKITYPKKFIDLVSSLCNYENDVAGYLMSYIAHLFQKPHENPHTAIVLKGNQGTGKDTLTYVIDKLMGNNYLVKLSDMGNLVGNFNDCLHNKLVIQINEMSGNDGYTYKNKIKDMITTETNVISKKYLPIEYQNNFIRWFMFSNNLVPVVIENCDRRFLICETANDFIGQTDYWNEFYKELNDDEYLLDILHYLHNYDISEWRPNNIPQTKDKKNLQINNTNPIHSFLNNVDWTKLQQAIIKNVNFYVISCQELYDDFLISEWGEDKYKSNHFKKQVSALKSIDIKRIKSFSKECFAIDLIALKKELTYYVMEAEVVSIDTKKRCLITD